MAKLTKPLLINALTPTNPPASSIKTTIQGCLAGIVILIILMSIIAYCNRNDSPKKDDARESSAEYIESLTVDGKLIGVWYDEELSLTTGKKTGYKFIVADNKLYVAPCTPDEENLQKGASTRLSPLATELVINKTQYTNSQNPNEYYIIDQDEDLLIYDEAGLIVECKRIFYDSGN